MLVDPAASQIEVEDGVVHLVMSHHPFSWLKNRQAFEDRLNAVAQVQLFGHEHTRRVEEGKYYLRIRAGALQPDRDDREWKPGYNWMEISIGSAGDKRHLSVRLWVRMYEQSQFITFPDRNNNEIWTNSYELPPWQLKKLLSPAVKLVGEKRDVAAVSGQESPMTDKTVPLTVRTVTLKLFKLKEHEQRRVISQLKLDRSGDRELKDYEVAISAVRRSKEEGNLDKLDELVDQTLAGGEVDGD
jgi:hypothetical protein